MSQFDLASLTSTQSLYDLTNKHSYKTLYLSVIVQALLDLTKPEQEGEASHIKVHRKGRNNHSSTHTAPKAFFGKRE